MGLEAKLIVCEGLDGAGKTTTIKELLKYNNDNTFVYSKGLGSNTFIGKLARKFPSAFMFMLELIYINHKVIKPNLKKNKIILQDRYDASILSYPGAEKIHNRLIGKILNYFVIKPDALIYFKVSLEERIKRLENDNHNKYHISLSKNPALITTREDKYLSLYNQFKGYKTKINTTNLKVEEAAKILQGFVLKIKQT